VLSGILNPAMLYYTSSRTSLGLSQPVCDNRRLSNVHRHHITSHPIRRSSLIRCDPNRSSLIELSLFKLISPFTYKIPISSYSYSLTLTPVIQLCD